MEDTCVAMSEAVVTTEMDTLVELTREDTDAALVAKTKNGDVGAFGDLLHRHQRAVYGIVSRMVSDRDDMDDAVQEVFVQAYKSIRGFKGNSAFSTWLYRIAVNTAIKSMQKSKIRQAVSIDDPDTGLSDALVSPNTHAPEALAEQNERNRAIREAISTLPDMHKEVVILHYFQNCSCDEIAKAMGCSVGTVWSRLHYACKKLQGQLNWLTAEGDNL